MTDPTDPARWRDIHDVCEDIEAWQWQLSPEDFRARLTEWGERLPHGALGRAEMWSRLAEAYVHVDAEKALTLVERALAEPGPTTLHPQHEQVVALLELGREEEARAAAYALMRDDGSRETTVGVFEPLGDVLEAYGLDKEAHRVYTVGLRDLDPELDEPDDDEWELLTGRYRVRRRLELGTDAYDRLHEELSAPEG